MSLGGGSTTGLGKAIALQTGLDQVVIPTTYAGSRHADPRSNRWRSKDDAEGQSRVA